MKRALVLIALSGCVSGVGLVRKDKVTVPLLIGATVADLVVGSLVFAQTDLSAAGAIASAIAFMAVDVGIGCIIGACAPLQP